MRHHGKLRLVVAVCALLVGCRDEALSHVVDGLAIEPEVLAVAPAWVGLPSSARLTLRNHSRAPLDVELSVGEPFTVPASVRLPAGEAMEVEVALTAAQPGPVASSVRVRWLSNDREVPVSADAVVPPSCHARGCRASVFDPALGRCVESNRADGEACGDDDACLVDATCLAGECVGAARSCDDGNACTLDVCVAALGCVHEDATASCPGSSDPCRVPMCDPVLGCGLADAVDGTACGPNDCQTAHVCIAGACVERSAPESSECAPATTCRGPGICRANRCELPPPSPLVPAWRYEPPVDHTVTFFGTVDADGAAYATEHWIESDGVRDMPVTALLKLGPSGRVDFKVPVIHDCPNCAWGLRLAVDSANHRVFFNAQGITRAHSTDDGRQLWTRDVTAGLPTYDRRPDGGGEFYTSTPLLLGGGLVAVPVSEGVSDHHAYVQALDRATGAQAWQFHRKGHLYGTGVTGSGELWTSSANCWAVAGEMARVSPSGQTLGARFVELIPSVYGQDFGLGTSSGRVQRIDGTLANTSLSVPSGAQLFTTGDRLVAYENASGRGLRAIELPTGTELWSYRVATGGAVDFELVRDGGVAFTASVSDGGFIGAVDGTGAERFVCPLSTSVESPIAIVRGRAWVLTGGAIVAYDVPGLDVEPTGWVTSRGSPERGGRAR